MTRLPPRVFVTWLDVAQRFYITIERILPSSTLVVFCGLLGALKLQSLPEDFFFLGMYQIVDLTSPNVFAFSLISGLFCFWRQLLCLLHLYQRLFWTRSENFTEQQSNKGSALGNDSRPFICLTFLEIPRE